MPYGRQGTGSSSSSGSSAAAGSVISEVAPFELAKTNLLVASGDFANAAWVAAGGLTVTANSTAAPNGPTQADTLTDASAVNTGSIAQAVAIPNDANPYTFSCYFALGTSTQAQIKLALSGGGAVNQSIDWTPANGAQLAAAGTGGGAIAVETLSIGGVFWARISATITNNASGNVLATCTVTPASANAAAVGTLIAWGAQLEQAAAATGLIQTDIVAVTRRAGRLPPYLQDHSFYSPRQCTTNYALDPDLDNGRLILCSSTLTLTLPSLASANPGWLFTFKNIATGVVTVQGTTATELLRVAGGLANGNTAVDFPFSATTGAGPYNVCGGVIGANSATLWELLDTIETHGDLLVTTNGSSFVVPAGVNTIWVDAAAGGGGGGSATSASGMAGGGGGGGGAVLGTLLRVVPGASHAIGIGAGGNGGTAGGVNAGSAGSTTTLGAILTVLGGSGGGSSAGGGGAGGNSGDFNSAAGQGGLFATTASNGAGGGNIFAAPTFNTVNATGGASLAGSLGRGYGGGGSGALSGATGATQAGGAGAAGFMRIRW